MKIALCVEEKSLSSEVCSSFGRTPYFLIYESKSKDVAFLDNLAVDSPGGAGIRAAQTLIDQNVEILLAPRCGENALAVLQSSALKVYQTKPGSATANLSDFFGEKLSELTCSHPGFHRGRNY